MKRNFLSILVGFALVLPGAALLTGCQTAQQADNSGQPAMMNTGTASGAEVPTPAPMEKTVVHHKAKKAVRHHRAKKIVHKKTTSTETTTSSDNNTNTTPAADNSSNNGMSGNGMDNSNNNSNTTAAPDNNANGGTAPADNNAPQQ